jgi:hypothetical protein
MQVRWRIRQFPTVTLFVFIDQCRDADNVRCAGSDQRAIDVAVHRAAKDYGYNGHLDNKRNLLNVR